VVLDAHVVVDDLFVLGARGQHTLVPRERTNPRLVANHRPDQTLFFRVPQLDQGVTQAHRQAVALPHPTHTADIVLIVLQVHQVLGFPVLLKQIQVGSQRHTYYTVFSPLN